MSDLEEYREPPKPALREDVIEQLKLNFAHGNLEVEEFEKRLELVLSDSKAPWPPIECPNILWRAESIGSSLTIRVLNSSTT